MRLVRVDDLLEWLAEHSFETDEAAPPPAPVPDRLGLIWPTTVAREVTQHYGINPQWYNGYGLRGHEGLDIYAPNGAPVLACADGVVKRVETIASSGAYGVHVRIEHDVASQLYETIYAHFQRAEVAVGQVVTAGQQIGRADNTGNSTGPHLHLTLKKRGDGSPWLALRPGVGVDIINPTPYFSELWWPGRRWRVDVAGNLRDAPSEQTGRILRWISVGEVLTVHDVGGQGEEWWESEIGGIRGWFWNTGYKLRAV